MDEIAKMLIGSSPIAAVILLLGNQVIQTWRDDLKIAAQKRSEIEKRLSAIEDKLGLVYTPPS